MKNTTLIIKTTLFVVFLLSNNIISAQNSCAELFEGWSEERCKEYCDSVYNAMFPRAIYKETNDNFVADSDTIYEDSFADIEIVGVSDENILSIDLTKSVAEIEIESGISPTGAKIYNVPLKTFPGINGLKPELSLSYNSQQGNSSVGYGWALSGIPKITRGHKNIYYDGVSEMNVGNGFVDTFCADVDGDMNESIIKVNNYVDFQDYDHIVFEVYAVDAILGHGLRYQREFNASTTYTDV